MLYQPLSDGHTRTLKHGLTGIVGGVGVATGIGLIVTGGMSSTPFTLSLGVPLAVIGSGIAIYSLALSGIQVKAYQRRT